MAQKIRVGAVSYLNTKPLIYGFEHGEMQAEIDLVIDYPANIASFLVNNQVDIGLVPVAVMPSLKEYHIISDYCIGSDGEVASVCLFSDVPLKEIKIILLDYQSRTSIELLKILLKEHWDISPKLVKATANYEQGIMGATAGLVIGDRSLQQRAGSKYIYDLGSAWKAHTGLPFVFAAWVSNKKIDPVFVDKFNGANAVGLGNLEQVIRENVIPFYNLQKYYTKNIRYDLDAGSRAGLQLFMQKINAANLNT